MTKSTIPFSPPLPSSPLFSRLTLADPAVSGFRVAVCAWRHAGASTASDEASAAEHPLAKPLSCPPPPPQILDVVDLSDIGGRLPEGEGDDAE